MNLNVEIILGSGSPRRKELMGMLGLPFRVEPAGVNEDFEVGMHGKEVARMLAERKADAFTEPKPHEVIVTCDTLVWMDYQVVNKPVDEADALNMLKQLNGKTHEVFSGVALRGAGWREVFTERTAVHFRKLPESWLEHYIQQYKPLDKAGAYGIQDWIGLVGVSGIEGCYYNVMGLPVSKLYSTLHAALGKHHKPL